MSSQCVIGISRQAVESTTPRTVDVRDMSPKSTCCELITADELAKRWNLPASWIRSHTRRRTLDEIPCIRLGRYVRFRWGSAELERWLAAHEGSRG